MNRGENKIKDEKWINPLPYGGEIVKFNKGGYNSYLKK